ncbi:Hypothetical protein NTJ_01000 [Nesidiocoris tenuis]|uniref:Uncharacterized protein n=1 Tax=Nesidiocoris tenuis TaxID=355587 RepID=A0ABN7A7G7_9HEMI|nr:Hypothetical protein NTJ_01000 [Nesidiocoris tenuis]
MATFFPRLRFRQKRSPGSNCLLHSGAQPTVAVHLRTIYEPMVDLAADQAEECEPELSYQLIVGSDKGLLMGHRRARQGLSRGLRTERDNSIKINMAAAVVDIGS